ncbi:MAG: dTDP-4-dehydrorhamnose 3,5-epimerase [Pseudomonadota bacterium]
MLPSAQKDSQQITEDWRKLGDPLEGVAVREVRHVPRDHGVITEIFRPEWDPTGLPVVHAYQSRLFAGALGAWSCHLRTTDRLFVSQGHVKVVLYDDRDGSKTKGRVMELIAGDVRPCLVVVPPGIWHGLQSLGGVDALVLNFPTEAYNYKDPDHYRLPYDAPEIPYVWKVSEQTKTRNEARTRG